MGGDPRAGQVGQDVLGAGPRATIRLRSKPSVEVNAGRMGRARLGVIIPNTSADSLAVTELNGSLALSGAVAVPRDLASAQALLGAARRCSALRPCCLSSCGRRQVELTATADRCPPGQPKTARRRGRAEENSDALWIISRHRRRWRRGECETRSNTLPSASISTCMTVAAASVWLWTETSAQRTSPSHLRSCGSHPCSTPTAEWVHDREDFPGGRTARASRRLWATRRSPWRSWPAQGPTSPRGAPSIATRGAVSLGTRARSGDSKAAAMRATS